MKNAVFMCVYNNLELTKSAVQSVFAQDIGPIYLWIIDNGSTDETWEWLREINPPSPHELMVQRSVENISPIKIANRALSMLFSFGYDKVLGVPNDVILPSNFYRELNRWPRGIVTASMTENKDFPVFNSATAVSTCTPLATGLIRKWAFDAFLAKDGYFLDEGMWHYASDCDLALRMAACGITGVQLDIQYYHFGSASHRLATPEDGDRMRRQADVDRAYFFNKWGFMVSDSQYGERCGNINFLG